MLFLYTIYTMNYRWGSSFLLFFKYFACTECFTFRTPSLHTQDIRFYAKPSKHKDVDDIDDAFMKDADDFYDRDMSKKKRTKGKKQDDVSWNLYKPKSIRQKQYVSYLKNDYIPLVVALGSAGSGKTLFACMEAIHQLRRGIVQKIILTRPLIPVEEEEIGFLPGNMNNKMDPWTRPIFDIFRQVFEPHEIESMVKHGIIEVAPLAFMRGRTFHQCFVVADEMQNSSPAQMLMLTTRIGKESKLVITGDLQQSDRNIRMENNNNNNKKDKMNGLAHFLYMHKQWEKTYADVNNLFYRSSSIVSENEDSEDEIDRKIMMESNTMVMEGLGIGIVEMTHEDVFRSPFVSRILDIYYPRTLTPLEIHLQKSAYEAQQVPDNDTYFQGKMIHKTDMTELVPFDEHLGQISKVHDDNDNDGKSNHPNYIPLKNMGRPYPL